MEFTIYSIGDIDFLEQVLIALAALTATDDFGAMVQVGLLVGVFAVVLSAIAKGGKEIEFQHVLLGFILYATMFVPTARVNIQDTFSSQVTVVDNVPMGAAAAGGIISLVGYKLTEMFEQGFNPIVPRMTDTEFSESLKLLTDLRIKSSQPPIWKALNESAGGGYVDMHRSWLNYIRDCTLKKIDLQEMTASNLLSTPYLEALEFRTALFGTTIYTSPGTYSGQLLDCGDAWDELLARTEILPSGEVARAFDAVLNLSKGTQVVSVTKTNTALNTLVSGSVTAQDYMRMSIIEPIIAESASGKYTEISDGSAAIMVNQAIQQRNTQWATEQTLFMTIVRPMIAFFEAFIYAVFPIMAFIIVLGQKGVQLAGKYFTMLIWIQLWMPILSIINLFIYTASSRELARYSDMTAHNWDSFYALNSGTDIMQTWIATGGMLAASTPAIALMLIYGSAVTATHLAGRLKGGDVVNEGYMSPELTNTPSILNQSSPFSFNPASGLTRTGEQFQDLNFSSGFLLNAASASREAHTITNDLNDTLSQGLTSSSSQSINYARSRDYAEAVKASNSEAYGVIGQTAAKYMETTGIHSDHREAVEGVIAATLGGQIGAGAELSSGDLFTQVQDQLKRIGVQPDDSEPTITKRKGVGMSGEASINADASGTIRESSSDSQTAQAGKQLTEGLSQLESTTTSAQWDQSVAEGFTETNSYNDQQTWGDTDAWNLSQRYVAANTRADTYEEMATKSMQFGAGGNISLDKAAVRTMEEGKGDELIQAAIAMSHRMGSDSPFTQLLNQNLKRYLDGVGDGQQAFVMAAYQTMAHPGAYGNDQIAASEGLETAFNTFLQSQGMAPTSKESFTAPTRNDGASEEPLTTDSPYRQATVETLQETEAAIQSGSQPAPSNISPLNREDESRTRAQYKEYKSTAESTPENILYGQGKENAAAYNAKEARDWGTEMSTATIISGASDVDEIATDRILGSLTGGPAGFVKGFSETLPTLVDDIQAMSPEEARAYTKQYTEDNNAFIRAHDSVAGFIASLTSDGKPEGMSYPAYYDALTGAGLTAIAAGGEQAMENLETIKQAAYSARIAEAKSFGLSEEDGTAQLYAESFVGGISQTFARAGEALGFDMDANYTSPELVQNMNQLKQSIVPATDSQGYEIYTTGDNKGQRVVDEEGNGIQHWHYTETSDGSKQVVLNDPTLDRFAENYADDIYKSGWTGRWGGGYLAEGKMILDMLNPDRKD